MSATTIMLVTFGILILTHWANSEPTISVKLVVEMVFAIIVIAMLDQGRTEPIAKGFSWLFLAAVLLSSKSILSKLSSIGSKTAAPAAKPKTQIV